MYYVPEFGCNMEPLRILMNILIVGYDSHLIERACGDEEKWEYP